MLYSKPVIVSDVGFYKELPADCVIKIDPVREHADLTAALERLKDGAERRALADSARSYAECTFRADAYARDVTRFGWDVRNAQPLVNLTDRVAGELGRMKVNGEMTIVDTMAATIDELFCGRQEGRTKSA